MTSPFKKSFAAEQLRQQQQQKKTGLWILLIVIGVIVVAGGYALYSRFVAKEELAPTEAKIKSIAVLPFEDLSPDKDQEWFCNGISESILNALTNVKDLRVIARTSSFEFKGKENIISEIGEKLNVEAILEGSVLKSGNQLLISTQLIKVSDESHLFSKQYDREAKDLISILKEIPVELVNELKLTIQASEKNAMEKQPTENLEAYNLYLKARHMGFLLEEDEFQRAIDYLQQAVQLDSDFALAYRWIAQLYYIAGMGGTLHRDEAFSKAKKAIDTAMEIDDKLAEIYITRGMTQLFGFFDFLGAEIEFKRAMELNPGNAEAHYWYGKYLRLVGRSQEALAEIKRAQMLNPLEKGWYQDAIALNNNMGRFEEGIAEFNTAIEIDPERTAFYNQLVRLYTKKGDYKKALELAKERGIGSNREIHIALISAKIGDRDTAKQILEKMIESEENTCYIAIAYAALGDNNSAFEWLEKAYQERNSYLVYIKTDQEFDPLRSDPRFNELLQKVGFK